MAECPFIPPYPQPLPKKASLLERFRIGWNSWIHTLSAQAYGMKMGEAHTPRLNFFVLNDLPLVARVMDDPDREFPKHRLLNDMLDPLLGKSVFSTNGQEWAEQRQMMNPAFQHTHLKRAFPAMAGATDALLGMMGDAARASGGAPVDIDPMMTHVAADIIFRTLFSVTLDPAESAAVYEAFNRYQTLAQPSTMLGLYGLPRLGYRWRSIRAARRVHAVFAPLVRARLEGGEAREDILQALIAARHPETGAPFGFQDLIDQVSIIFLAGHETSASAMGWACYLLSECPELQDRLYAEIEEVTGGDPITFEHLKRLDGVRNLFRETLRLYPPVSFFPREVTRAQTMRDKALAPGDLVVVSPWLIQRNAENWPCPHAFDPDRFTREESTDATKNAWLPFGRGPRICIGAGFAQQEGLLVLASIIRAFRLDYPKGAEKPEPMSRLTLRPKGGIRVVLAGRG